MIEIERSNPVPRSLKKQGARQTKIDCDAYDACPDGYENGDLKFLWRGHYSKKEVKNRLVKMHRYKCCYCEQVFRPEYLHIEHFRPKGRVRQAPDSAELSPGYFWLAYRWDNLLLACHGCNTGNKKTLFPLKNPKERALTCHDDVATERPLFIDPTELDPRAHIRFAYDAPVGNSSEGDTTIRLIGLRRRELLEERLTRIKNIDVRLAILSKAEEYPGDDKLKKWATEARQFIEDAVRPEAPFSSMAIDYLAQYSL